MSRKIAIFSFVILFLMLCQSPGWAMKHEKNYSSLPTSELPAQSCSLESSDDLNSWFSFCSATIVGATKLLTAGHCFLNKLGSGFYIRAVCDHGREIRYVSHRVFPPTFEEAIRLAETRKFPNLTLNGKQGLDISVLTVTQRFLSPPIPLPRDQAHYQELTQLNKNCTAQGYGRTDASAAPVHRGVKAKIHEPGFAIGQLMHYRPHSEGEAHRGEAPDEPGDSGSGFICQDAAGDKYVVAALRGDGVLTSVSHTLDWLHQQVGEFPAQYFRHDPATGATWPERLEPNRVYIRKIKDASGKSRSGWVRTDESGTIQPIPFEGATAQRWQLGGTSGAPMDAFSLKPESDGIFRWTQAGKASETQRETTRSVTSIPPQPAEQISTEVPKETVDTPPLYYRYQARSQALEFVERAQILPNTLFVVRGPNGKTRWELSDSNGKVQLVNYETEVTGKVLGYTEPEWANRVFGFYYRPGLDGEAKSNTVFWMPKDSEQFARRFPKTAPGPAPVAAANGYYYYYTPTATQQARRRTTLFRKRGN